MPYRCEPPVILAIKISKKKNIKILISDQIAFAAVVYAMLPEIFYQKILQYSRENTCVKVGL